jgi:hypothetical protein
MLLACFACQVLSIFTYTLEDCLQDDVWCCVSVNALQSGLVDIGLVLVCRRVAGFHQHHAVVCDTCCCGSKLAVAYTLSSTVSYPANLSRYRQTVWAVCMTMAGWWQQCAAAGGSALHMLPSSMHGVVACCCSSTSSADWLIGLLDAVCVVHACKVGISTGRRMRVFADHPDAICTEQG